MPGLRQDERGVATTEAVLVVPVLLFLVMLIIQFGLWFHASHVARAAAQEGVRAARLEGATAAVGQDRAEAFLERNGPTLVSDPVVVATRDGEQAVVEVRGRSVAVVPSLHWAVQARAESPVERFRDVAP
jgi:Flp pilus assembly protein TadG